MGYGKTVSHSKAVKILDTTLRDGEQTPGVGLTVREKVEIAKQLARLRVDAIEAGFAASSPGDFEAVRAVAGTVGQVTVASLSRAKREDIDRAWAALEGAAHPRIHIFLATSPIHMKHKLGMTEAEVLATAHDSVSYAASTGAEVEFSAEDATRSDPAFLVRVFTCVAAAGARVLNIPDTVGYTTPPEYADLVEMITREVRLVYPGVQTSVHCHDDLGLAVANTLSAISAGVDWIEGTINGLGERAGNAALEEVVMGLQTRPAIFRRTAALDTRQLARTSRLVSGFTGIVVQPNKAVVGSNAFAHQSGIHQDGVLKQPLTYEIMRPEDVGLVANSMVLGKLSGRHAVRQRLGEMGYTLVPARFERVFARFKELADRKRVVAERDLEVLVEDEMRDGPESIALESFHVVSGNSAIPTATVRLKVGSEVRQEACTGSGPVDALFRALALASGLGAEARLADYTLKAVTSGEDALGECTLRLEVGERAALGRGASTDVIEASALAYVKALNRLAEAAEATGQIPSEATAGAAGPGARVSGAGARTEATSGKEAATP